MLNDREGWSYHTSLSTLANNLSPDLSKALDQAVEDWVWSRAKEKVLASSYLARSKTMSDPGRVSQC